MSAINLDKIFHPKSIAVVGASQRAENMQNFPLLSEIPGRAKVLVRSCSSGVCQFPKTVGLKK
jgi:hypothetical protein